MHIGATFFFFKESILLSSVIIQHYLQIIKLKLIGATNGGSIGRQSVANIVVPANDNPYGTVYFDQSVHRVWEPLEGVYIANITVRRR